MAAHAIDEMIRVTLVWDLDGNLAENVWHFATSTSTVTQTNVNNALGLAQDIVKNFGATGDKFIDQISEEVQIVEFNAITLDPTNPLTGTLIDGDTGSVAGGPVPLESAVVLTLYTDLATRRGRGRTFVPGISNGSLTAGRLGTDAAGDFAFIFGQVIGAMPQDGLNWVVWSPTDQLGRDITAVTIRNTLHHQRRRNS